MPTAPPLPHAVRIGAVPRPELLAALRERGVRLNPAAETLFADPRFTTLDRPRLVRIAARSVAELGLGDGATYAQLVARARESGLSECPLELGPHLRTQLTGRWSDAGAHPPTRNRAPPGSITVASPPLDDRDDTPKGFYLRDADGASWLRGYWSGPDHLWSPEDVLVFAVEGPFRDP